MLIYQRKRAVRTKTEAGNCGESSVPGEEPCIYVVPPNARPLRKTERIQLNASQNILNDPVFVRPLPPGNTLSCDSS